jgi:hypothetical protein
MYLASVGAPVGSTLPLTDDELVEQLVRSTP